MAHDATNFVSQLRDHLAAHDRPIAFLFGAGTSCCVNVSSAPNTFIPLIPSIAPMTTSCQRAVEATGTHQADAWTKLIAECNQLGILDNIESILGRIRSKLDAITGTDKVNGLSRTEWEGIDATVRTEIARLVNPASVPNELPHHDFARWVRDTSRHHSIEIFTTNYDVLFETSFDSMRVPHFDGFVGSQHPYFCADAVEDDRFLPPSSWVRYWKIHGSTTWTMETIGTEARITRGKPGPSGELILPSHRKYDESRKEPYRSLMDRLTRVLARSECLFVTAGYSFSDQHINAIIFDALEQNPRTHLFALMFGDSTSSATLASRAQTTANIVVVGRNDAIISRRLEEWSIAGKPSPQVAAATFDLVQASPLDATKPQVHIGDFVAFTRFLRRIQGGN